MADALHPFMADAVYPFRVVKYVSGAESFTKLAFAYVSDGTWSIDVYSARPELPENREEIMRLAQQVADALNRNRPHATSGNGPDV